MASFACTEISLSTLLQREPRRRHAQRPVGGDGYRPGRRLRDRNRRVGFCADRLPGLRIRKGLTWRRHDRQREHTDDRTQRSLDPSHHGEGPDSRDTPFPQLDQRTKRRRCTRHAAQKDRPCDLLGSSLRRVVWLIPIVLGRRIGPWTRAGQSTFMLLFAFSAPALAAEGMRKPWPRLAASGNEAPAQRRAHRLGPGVDPQLFIDAGDVICDGVHRHPKGDSRFLRAPRDGHLVEGRVTFSKRVPGMSLRFATIR